MIRASQSLLAILTAASAAPALGQSGAASEYPIRAEPRHGGVYDIRTGRRIAPGSRNLAAAATKDVYANTCTTPFSFLPLQPCEQAWDEGLVPNELAGGTRTGYDIEWIDVAYCTYVPSGAVDIDFALSFTSQVSGMCATSTPPAGTPNAASFSSSAVGFPLPGSTGAGALACWVVTLTGSTTGGPLVQCFDGGDANERFAYTVRSNNTAFQGGGFVGGPMLAGDPLNAPPGAGTFDIPGGSCASGLGNADSLWINVDGTSVGGTPSCAGAHGNGTNCYTFGYPAGPFAGLYLKITAPANYASACDCDPTYSHYCTAKTNSLGCTPEMVHDGCTDTNGGLMLFARNLLGSKNGIFFYGTTGTLAAPFQGGFLCVNPPILRTPVSNSGGTNGQCDGLLAIDFSAVMAANSAIHPGSFVALQTWTRDPGDPFGTGLSAAVSFTVMP